MTWGMDGRVAVVTGASRGIGRAIARTLAAHGADVVVVARNADLLDEVAAEISDMGRACKVVVSDVLEVGAAERIASAVLNEFPAIDVLVNNAGGNSFMSPVNGMRPAGWRKTMSLNLDSVFELTQALLPNMIEHRRGSIINVASVAGLRGSPLMSHYGAAKAALISFTQSLAVEVAYAEVRVNALVPGWIETDLTDFLRHDQQTEQGALSRVPMARWGTVEEIADGALFLASDASSFMTGQTLILDGGLSAMP